MYKKDKMIGSIVIAVMCVIFLIIGYLYTKPKANNAEIAFKTSSPKEEVVVDNSRESSKQKTNNNDEYKTIVVEIKGEIKKPNVYKMEYGSRVYQLIDKAGGYTKNADTTSVNGSMKLKDEDCIVILAKGDKSTPQIKNNIRNSSGSTASSDSEKIDINTATKEQLKTLPGVGDVTAEKIIDYREKNGGFSSIDDMKKIDRIGEKTLSKFKDKIEIR